MNKVTKKILTLLMAVTLVVGMFTTTYADETKKINVTFTIERFTIGQGFLVEPVTVQVNEGAAAKDVLEEVAKALLIFLKVFRRCQVLMLTMVMEISIMMLQQIQVQMRYLQMTRS